MNSATFIKLPFLGTLILLFTINPLVATDVNLFEARIHKFENESMPYRLFHARNYDKSQKYPLIIFMHGSGERGNDNVKQIRYNFPDVFIEDASQDRNPCFIMAPQCPQGPKWSEEKLHQVKTILDSLQTEFSIDSERLYVFGLSMGGRGTFNMLAQYPDLFAAAIPCAGGNNPSLYPRIMQTPMWLHCSTKVPEYPIPL
jgi:predicted peptidase